MVYYYCIRISLNAQTGVDDMISYNRIKRKKLSHEGLRIKRERLR